MSLVLGVLSPRPLSDGAVPTLSAVGAERTVWSDVEVEPQAWQRVETFAAGTQILSGDALADLYDGDSPAHFFIHVDGTVRVLPRWLTQQPAAGAYGGSGSVSVVFAGDALSVSEPQKVSARRLMESLGLRG